MTLPSLAPQLCAPLKCPVAQPGCLERHGTQLAYVAYGIESEFSNGYTTDYSENESGGSISGRSDRPVEPADEAAGFG